MKDIFAPYIHATESKASRRVAGSNILSVVGYRIIATIGDSIDRRVDAFRRWRERRTTVAALSALDDRMLKDIGVRRDDIYSVVEELGKDHPLAPVGTTRPASQIVSTQSASADAANDDDFESAA